MLTARLRSRLCAMVLAGAIAVCAACASASGSRSTTNASIASAAATPTSAPHYHAGDTVTIGTVWQVTIAGIKVLGSGDTASVQRVGVDMTLKYTGAQPARLDDGYSLILLDANGQRHGIGEQTGICQLASGATSCVDALTLDPGAQQSGDIGAVTPVDQTQFTLTIASTTGVGNAGAVTWDLGL